MLRYLSTLLFHPNRNTRTLITLIYTILALAVNFFALQVFCVPVWWTAVPLLVFIVSLLLFPYSNYYLKIALAIGMGIGVFISVYSILFLSDPWGNYAGYIMYSMGIILGIGLLPFIFVYYLYHICKYFIQSSIWIRNAMAIGIIIPVIVTIIYLIPFEGELSLFNKACGNPPQSSPQLYKEVAHPELLKANNYTEQFLGIGIKYHTKLDFEYDGWRPPIHNPLLNIGLWIYSNTYYPQENLKRTKYYKQVFPNKTYMVNCTCSFTYDALTYRKGYYWHWEE